MRMRTQMLVERFITCLNELCSFGGARKHFCVLWGTFLELWGTVGCLRVAGGAFQELLEAPARPLGSLEVAWACLGRPFGCPWHPLGILWMTMEALEGARSVAAASRRALGGPSGGPGGRWG